MAYPEYTSGYVMDRVGSLLNDRTLSVYTYEVQLPFLNQALQELKEYFELNNIPVTDTVTSDPIEVPNGVGSIGFAPDPPIVDTPYLPDDLVEPKIVWQAQSGQNQFIQIPRVDFLPRNQQGIEINQIMEYVWQSQELRFLPANTDIDIKLDYIRNLFNEFVEDDGSDVIGVVNSETYLQYKTGALVARFIAENPTRADILDTLALSAMDRSLGIGTKGRQRIQIRRRPFRANYKRRTFQ
jgi:hypothetical protein